MKCTAFPDHAFQGLRLTQMQLSHERYVAEAESKIMQLENDITTLEAGRREEQQLRISSPLSTPVQEQRTSRWRLW
jgi:hypothetical protein